MEDEREPTPAPVLRAIDGDSSGGPVVTPPPAPPDDQLIRLVGAAVIGALIGSFIAFRWLRRHVEVSI